MNEWMGAYIADRNDGLNGGDTGVGNERGKRRDEFMVGSLLLFS